MKKIIASISFLFVLLFVSLPAIALTNVTQNITQNTTWSTSGSPYIIESDIQVYPNTRLTIEPGVEVVIHIGASLIIGGELIAIGEPANSIIFDSNVTVPASNQPAGIVFESTAARANFWGGLEPIFSYDHTNREVKLIYESGSILKYCQFSGLSTAIELNGSYPYMSNNLITNCPRGIRIFGGSQIPIPQWLFLYHNTIENCSQQAMFVEGVSPSTFVLFTGNIIQSNVDNDQEWAAYLSNLGADTFLLLFNNSINDNKGYGIVNNGVYTFLYADNNEIVGNGQGLTASNAILLNNTITNNNTCSYPVWAIAKGAGVYLNGPRAVLFNNTIQANEICPGDKGDNIMLKSLEGNQFTIQYNNLGNSNGDMQDIYLDSDYQGADCNTSQNMDVIASYNFWASRDTNNLSLNIFDINDDFCAGTVNYQPVLPSEITSSNLSTYPKLIAPAKIDYKPGTLTLNFSWEPVSGATKYLLCTNGWANIPTEAMRIKEVQGQTSAEITYSPYTDYSQKYVYWFVVAGNDNGWSLPSEIRKVYFSTDPYLINGRILDENEETVAEVYIKGEGEPVFSDNSGNYSYIMRDASLEGQIYTLKKEGYSDCYTFPRFHESFDIFGDLTLISNSAKDAMYNACGEILDTTRGTIAGIVVDKNDQVLTGAEVYIEPSSGNIYYLNENNLPDFSLTETGASGKFIILNVAPGNYRISADIEGYDFSITDSYGNTHIGPGITVYEDSITVDALTEKSAADTSGGGGGTSSNGDGGGGGGGIFGIVNLKDVIGYHLDWTTKDGMAVYMPVTNGFKALKGAQTHVERFAPGLANFIRESFDALERIAKTNQDGLLSTIGTYIFPALGRIAGIYLYAFDSRELMDNAYSNTTISVKEFNKLNRQGKAISSHIVKEDSK